MDITKEAKKQEALRRLHVLADRFNLGSKLEKNWQGKQSCPIPTLLILDGMRVNLVIFV